MSKPGKGSIYLKTFLKDMLFIVPFFLISCYLVHDTVPSYTLFWIAFWTIVTATMMSGIAWIALQMFKVVLADQIARKKAGHTVR